MTANGRARFGDDFPDLQEFLDKVSSNPFEENGPDTSSLEPQETSSQNVTDWTYRGRFLQGREEEHAATREAYRTINSSPSNSHNQAMDNCRKFATLQRDKTTGEVKVFADSCKDRWCPMCAAQKSQYAKESTTTYIKSLKDAKFLTLTLRANESDLKTQLDFLIKSFRTLRQRAYWKRNVDGGIWFLQCKRGKNSGLWHPHLHILFDGNRMEQENLSALWELVTFGSPVIDIRQVHDIDYTASYVARYSARPAKLAKIPLEDRIEIINALFGKRLCGTFGTAKTVTLTPPKIEATGEWSNCGYYDEIMKDAAKNPAAAKIVSAFINEIPLTEEDFEAYTGQPVFIEVEPWEPYKPKQLCLDFFKSG